jgi:hypothetical protein
VRRAAIAVLVASLAVGLSAPPATAAVTRVDDGNDTPGRLDIRYVSREHVNYPRFNIHTFARWSVRSIWDRGNLVVRLDTRHGERFDYYALIRADGGRLVASLWRDYRRRADGYRGSLPEGRTGRRSAYVVVPLKRLDFGAARSVYRWQAETLYIGPTRCNQRLCIDRAPNRHGRAEPIPDRY